MIKTRSVFRRLYSSAILILVSFAFYFYGCQLLDPNLPSWDTDLNLPITDKTYDIFDIITRSSNIGVDSSDGNSVYIYGTSSYKREFGEDIEFDGFKVTGVQAPSVFALDTALTFDDSTFVERADFLNGELRFTFNNSGNQDYSVIAAIGNLFHNESGDTVRITEYVPSGKQRTVVIGLSGYYISNLEPDNKIKLRIRFESAQPVLVDFTYELSQYSIRSLKGRMRPLRTGKNFDEVIDPFGSDVPEGSVNFAKIRPNTNFLNLRRYSSNYQVDFSDISLIGENKNGNRVRLKYLKNGNPGDPLDTLFTLTLPQETDSLSYPINEDNSNILEFLNNIPKKIILERVDFLNRSYEEGHIRNRDSLIIRFDINVPLNVSIIKPIQFTDTADVGIDDQDLRNELDNLSKLKLNLDGINGLPLKGVVNATLLDSSYNYLLPLTFLAGGSADSSVTVGASSVGPDGLVIQPRTVNFTAEIEGEQIDKLKRMGKIVLDYRLFTDPDLITPPGTTVKIRSTDITRTLIFGTVRYRIDP